MKKLFILIVITVICISSCTDSKRAKILGYGNEFTIEMVNCDGSVSKTWISTGKVSSEKDSDGYYFMEKGTNKLIEVTGRLIITKN